MSGLMPVWRFIPTVEIVICVIGLVVLLLGFWMVRPRRVRKWITASYWAALLPTVFLVITLAQAVQTKNSEAELSRQWERFRPPCRIILAVPPR